MLAKAKEKVREKVDGAALLVRGMRKRAPRKGEKTGERTAGRTPYN